MRPERDARRRPGVTMLKIAGSMIAAVNSGMNSQARAANCRRPMREAGTRATASASSTSSTVILVARAAITTSASRLTSLTRGSRRCSSPGRRASSSEVTARSTQAASVAEQPVAEQAPGRRGRAGCAGPPAPPAGASSQAGTSSARAGVGPPSAGARAASRSGGHGRTHRTVSPHRRAGSERAVRRRRGRPVSASPPCAPATRRRSLTSSQTIAVSTATPTSALTTYETTVHRRRSRRPSYSRAAGRSNGRPGERGPWARSRYAGRSRRCPTRQRRRRRRAAPAARPR